MIIIIHITSIKNIPDNINFKIIYLILFILFILIILLIMLIKILILIIMLSLSIIRNLR